MSDSPDALKQIKQRLQAFFQQVKATSNLEISDHDLQTLQKGDYTEPKINGICRKYDLATAFLKKYDSPAVRKTIQKFLNRSVQSSIPVLSRLKTLLTSHQAGWLNQDQFEKLHFYIVSKVSVYNAFQNLQGQAEQENIPKANFREYFDSGLFEQGIYTLYKSTQSLEDLCQKIKNEIENKYGFKISPKDESFILHNRMRNEHVIYQIIIPKYRVANSIHKILGKNYFPNDLQSLLYAPFNEGLPILKRILALAKWTDQGYLSHLLTQYYHQSYIQDVDSLENLFIFLEMLSEQVSKPRAIHYLEMGLYQVFNQSNFGHFLEIEHIFYDAEDNLRESIVEYITIMKTPGNSKLLVTNGRLADCFFKFKMCVQLFAENIDLLEITKLETKVVQYLAEFKVYHEQYLSKNLSLPTQKPYGAINVISKFIQVYIAIENQLLLKNSIFLAKSFQNILATRQTTKKDLEETFQKRYQERLHYVQLAMKPSTNISQAIAKLIPTESSPAYILSKFLKK